VRPFWTPAHLEFHKPIEDAIMYAKTAHRYRPTIIGLILCGVLLQLSLHALAAGRIGEIDFTLGPRGHLLVPVTVNGTEQGLFALDTGATTNVLTPEFADRLGTELKHGAPVQAHGAHASADVRFANIQSMRVGEVAGDAGPSIIMDLSHVNGPDMQIDGIVGNSFLHRYDLVIDFPDTRIELNETGSLAAAGAAYSAAVDIAEGMGALIYLDVVVNGQPMTAVLDTGSGRSAINSAAAKALGLEVPRMPETSEGHGTRLSHAPAIPDIRVELGAATLTSEAPVHIKDLDVFEVVGLSEKPAMLLGTNFLKDRRLGIDYRARRIYL
jgi:predicted aspartyl protease